MFGIMFYNVNKRNYEFGYFDVCVCVCVCVFF